MILARCDINTCNRDIAVVEGVYTKTYRFLNKEYHLCSECLKSMEIFIQRRLSGGRDTEKDKQPGLPSYPSYPWQIQGGSIGSGQYTVPDNQIKIPQQIFTVPGTLSPTQTVPQEFITYPIVTSMSGVTVPADNTAESFAELLEILGANQPIPPSDGIYYK